MKYITRLLIGFGSFLSMLFLLLVILSNILADLNKNINEIVDDRYVKLNLVNMVQNNVNNMSRLVTNIVLDEAVESMNADNAAFDKSITAISTALGTIQQKTVNERSNLMLLELGYRFTTFVQKSNVVIQMSKAGEKAEAIGLMNQELNPVRDDLLAKMEQIKKMQESVLDEAYNRASEQYQFIRSVAISFIVLGLLAGLLIAAWVIRGISKNLQGITSVISSVSFATIDKLPRIPVKTKDEIGNIARAFNEMAESLEHHTYQEKEYKCAMQEHNWLKTQITDIVKSCQEVQDINRLSQVLISKLAPLTGSSHGVLFTREGNGDSQCFVKTGIYAQEKQEMLVTHIELGEGLVGQCALENKPFYLTQIPSHYFKIGSALGGVQPSALIILPISYEGQVLAVMELASLYDFTPLQQNFLHEVAGSIGAVFSSILKHMQVRNLLRESQALTEELQSQSEELRLQQEELRSINEKLEDQYRSSEMKAKELEKVKEELESNAIQIKQASRYKSEFLANMSHELRTPLNSLLILAQILAENKEKNLSEKQVEFAETIFSSGNNLLHLINDILDLTKVESGKMDIHPAEVELQEIANQLERGFRPVATQKQLDFTIRMDDQLPPFIWTDEQRLLQIITNLLSNAFKFTAEGSVYVDICLQKTPEGSNVAFHVCDTGSGIPLDKQSIIFEAFQQADGTTSRKYGGTGLGLSISREMAHLLGGFIRVKSDEGKGSIFTLYLPLTRENVLEVQGAETYALAPVAASLAQHTKAAADVSGEEGLAGQSVLVVDDDMRNIFALTAALEERGMSVYFAENGRECVHLLQDHPDLDIVLMDIMMPEMDGYETIENIRSMPAFQKLPIIALTAKAMKHDREKCMEAGASDYISKPVNMEQLISLMRVWLYR